MIDKIYQEQLPSLKPVTNRLKIWLLIEVIFIIVVLIGLGVYYLWQKSELNQNDYVLGEVLVTLKPHTDKDILFQFVNQHPELSLRYAFTIESSLSGTLSLKPYSEWQKKVLSNQKDVPEVRLEISNGESKLLQIYEKLKTNSVLEDSNIWSSFYSDIEPDQSYFSIIHFSFEKGTTSEERKEFFGQFPELEIVGDFEEETETYKVIVPKGKEKYWMTEFQKLNYIKYAGLNYVLKLID